MENQIQNREKISVVVPTRNLENTIQKNIQIIERELDKLSHQYEIIVVDDASVDQTYSRAKKFASEKIRIYNFPQHHGKGYALKYGFYHSSGNLIVFIDGDLDLHPNQIEKFIKILKEKNADVVIGSKRHKASIVDYPRYRRFLSFCYQILVKILLNLNLKDTQVGLKLFKRKVLKESLPRVIVKRYAFDLELLTVIAKLGYKITEAPINLKYQFSGTGINLKAIKNMLQDTLAVFYRLKLLKYYRQNIITADSRFKILILNWRDIKNPKSGGAEIVTFELAKNWVKQGIYVAVFSAAFPGSKKEEEIDGVKIFRKGRAWSVHFWAWCFYKKYLQGKFNIVIDEINTIPFFTPLYVLPEKKLAFIHQLAREVWWYEFPFPLNIIGYLLEPLYLKIYKKTPIITVSESSKESLRKIGLKKIQVIKEGVNFSPIDKLSQKENKPTFIYLGRINKSKRIEHIIEAIKIARQKFPEIKLDIVGRSQPNYQKKLLKKIKKLELDKNIDFWGYVDEEDKKRLLARAWALLMTSVREGWGLVINEANALGTPAIVYNVPGLRDSVNNNLNGLIIENPNPLNLANTLSHFIKDINLRERLIRNALKQKRITWIEVSEQALKIIRNI